MISGRAGPSSDHVGFTHVKHRPQVAGGGQNLPLEIIRAISHWLSVLGERGSVTGKYQAIVEAFLKDSGHSNR